MKLRTRLLASILAISVLPMVIITMITYNRLTAIIDEQMSQVADMVFNKAVTESNSALDKIDQIYQLFTLYTIDSSSVLDDIVKYSGDGEFNDYDIFLSNQKLKFICQSAIFSNDCVNGVFFFTPSGVTLGYGYGGNTDLYYGYNPTEDDWYQKTLSENGGMYIDGITTKSYIINAKPSVSFSCAVYEPFSRKFLGVLMVDCQPKLFDIGAVNSLPELITLSVENTDTGFMLYSNADALNRKEDSADLSVTKAGLRYEDLVLTQAVNYRLLYQQFDSTQQMIFAFGLISAAAIMLTSILFSRSMARPIMVISRKMADRSGHNKIINNKYLSRGDEVGVLCNEYNALLDELENIVTKEYQHRLIMLDSQMRALEAQIDSHFLFNTLESINSIAEIEKVESIATMSQALGNMFRYSIKTKSEMVSVAEELGHVGDYVSIQMIRFSNAFKLELDFPPEVLELKILKLIMQPLVENALKHGLRNCQSGDVVRIRGSLEDDCIILCVEDNGVGIAGEQLGILREDLAREPRFSELGQRNAQSIGLKNIHSRIELYYGKGYGLSISSSPGRGTSVTIRVPCQKLR